MSKTTIRYTGQSPIEICVGQLRYRFEPDEAVEVDQRFANMYVGRLGFEAAEKAKVKRQRRSASTDETQAAAGNADPERTGASAFQEETGGNE